MNTPEPVMIRAFVAAVLQVLAAFGVGVTQEQIGALDALVLAAIPVITLLLAFLARQKVTPSQPPHDSSRRA